MITINTQIPALKERRSVALVSSVALHVLLGLLVILMVPSRLDTNKKPPVFRIVSLDAPAADASTQSPPPLKPPRPQPVRPEQLPQQTSPEAPTIETPETTSATPDTAAATSAAATTNVGASSGPSAPGGSGGGVDTNAIYEMGGVAALYDPRPEDPPVLREQGIEGHVRALITINRRGTVDSVRILASDNPLFDRVVKRTLATWRFRPALVRGVAVRVQALKPIDFTLE
jgi:protein TonB